ncbi:hypothetical protein LUZ61_013792 [Rhynchospora tenuis]|uniref:Uncharacterized protein n=1 Tax=Rhynchospora tenuis TaxID=198213 RepID=A0AAD5WB76_9POAL|nr:hypothetical protein LUZ61_013792 [Rhynchospora tenuis]
MAEVLLNAVLSKLGKFSVGKLMSLYEIRDDVESLSRELQYIQACIVDADKKRIVDQTQKIWVRDLMDVTYQIENSVETFLLEYPEKFPGIINNLKGWPKDITKIPFLRDFQNEIERIRKQIKEITEFKQKYIITLGEEKIPESNSEVKLDPIDNPDVVGFAKHRDQIVERLLDQNVQELAIVSIVGIGGLGKTTLAVKVCNSEKVINRFGKPIWITISQKYELLHILRTLAKKLEIDSTNKNEQDLADRIRESLGERTKPYLIVLDDVWTEKLWKEVAKVLPDTKKGSRALITTRNENVVYMADAPYKYVPYNVPLLSEEDSVKLLLKKAVTGDRQYCPDPNFNYKDLAKKFVKKCGYLPLALIVLGGLLRATQPFDFHAWNELLETMTWEDDECTEIIAASYKHLPLAKKWCFLYLAAYPEDTKIDVERLLRIWVADGLIPDDKKNTLEQTAASFLKDLAQRSMVQVVQSNCDGSMKYCQVHDILRDLAVREAEENNFLKVCSKPDDWKYCKAHRAAIHYVDAAELTDNNTNSTVRSLLLFGDSSVLDCSKYSVLRVLGMEGRVSRVNFEGSRHLRYLRLDTNIDNLNNRDQFWKWVKSMNYLETLDLQKLMGAGGDLSNDNTIVLGDGLLPPYLLELHLRYFKFESDPMPVLEKLGSLKILSIENSTMRKDKDVRIRCSSGGFKQLEELNLDYTKKLEKWEIQIGAMPMLKCLRAFQCDPLPPPVELIQLPSLRYLDWRSDITENNSSISEIFKQRPDLKSRGPTSSKLVCFN